MISVAMNLLYACKNCKNNHDENGVKYSLRRAHESCKQIGSCFCTLNCEAKSMSLR